MPASLTLATVIYGNAAFCGLDEQIAKAETPSDVSLDDDTTAITAQKAFRLSLDASPADLSAAAKYFDAEGGRIRSSQDPLMTLLTCGDSRVPRTVFAMRQRHWSDHVDAHHGIDLSAPDRVFEVRNIGNQMNTAPGSILYPLGVIKTPLCLVLGHTGCGAVKASASNYTGLDPDIQNELTDIGLQVRTNKEHVHSSLPHEHKEDEAYEMDVFSELNVDSQVARICSHRALKAAVAAGSLTVVGAVFDVRCTYGKGPGRIFITNINGIKDLEKIREHSAMRHVGPSLKEIVVHRLLPGGVADNI